MGRHKMLLDMGFRGYRDYLRSPLWKKIRRRVVVRYDGRCVCCDAEAECVHHTIYSGPVLRGETINGLFPLCFDCHKYCEFKSVEKMSLRAARNRMRRRARKNGMQDPYNREADIVRRSR